MAIRAVVLVALVLAALIPTTDVSAQKSSKVYRLGWVSLQPPPTVLPDARFTALKARLAERGYVEGKNIVFEPRWASGDYQRVPQLAAELEQSRVDVIFTHGTRNARILHGLVKTTPLVVSTCDPFEHVARLARHGGNVTGITCLTAELSPKRLELLKEAIPTASRVAFLSEPEDAPLGLKLTQDAAPRLGITLPTVGFKASAEMPRALDLVAKERPDAVFVYPDPIAFAARGQIAEFALRHRLPTMNAFREFVDAGGLMSYGARQIDLFTVAADLIAQIFEGARAEDLPFRQATRFELVINMKTAKAIGVAMPPSLLLRADHVIE